MTINDKINQMSIEEKVNLFADWVTTDTRSFDIGEKGDLFAVLEDYEIIGMISSLIWALKKCKCEFKEVYKGG